MKLQWKWAESVNGRFQRKFPLSPQSLTHCPPVSFTKPLRASHASQEPVWRRDWDQFESFLNTTLPFFSHQISNKYWVNCQEWNCWRGLENVVAECQKICTFYVVLDVFLEILKFFFWRGRSRIGARLFQWLCSIFLNFCVLWYRNPSLMGQQNITRSTETQELLVFIISWKYCLGQTWKLELDGTPIQ